MTITNNWKIHTHLSEEAAKSLAKAQAELISEHPELALPEIQVNDEGVSMPTRLAFDLLYRHNRPLWEEVLDAFIDIAQEVYLEHKKIDPDSDHDCYLENGVDIDDEAISVLR